MRRRSAQAVVFAVAALGLMGEVSAADGGEPRRYALVVGQNLGDGADEPLRFANEDARRFLAVMRELGGVAEGDAVTLYDATARTLREALGALRARLAAEASGRDQLVVYISSHADAGELHLAGSRLPLAELQSFLADAPVDLALLVLDSCRSGALTRLKGLRPVQGTRVRIDAGDLKGRVIITSSGADEYAQESDELGGSYFTHHLVSGLRGAADVGRDGRVTLQEAYAYAYARTLESTFASRGGLQRPRYKVDLRGHGQLVLSDLGRGEGLLTIAVPEPGRWQVLSSGGDRLISRFSKPEGPATVALPPGAYRLKLRMDEGHLEGGVVIAQGGKAVVTREALRYVPAKQIALKGAGRDWSLALGGAGTTGLVTGLDATWGAGFRMTRRWPPLAGEVTVAVGFRRGQGALAVPFQQQEWELRAGVAKTVRLGRLKLSLGPEAGALLAHQAHLPGGEQRLGLGAVLDLVGVAKLSLRDRWGLFLAARGGAVLIKKDSGLAPTPRGGAALGFSVDL